MLERLWRKENPLTQLVEMQNDTATMESSLEVPQELKTKPPYDPATPVHWVVRRKQEHSLKKIYIYTPSGLQHYL